MVRDSVDSFFASSGNDCDGDGDDDGHDDDDDDDDDSGDDHSSQDGQGSRPQTAKKTTEPAAMAKPAIQTGAALESMTLSPPAVMAAWMEAWREQLAQRFQDLQFNMRTIPAAVDYQTLFQNHMAKFPYPMPKWNTPKPQQQQQQRRRQGGGTEYKWSELFNPPLPPAYDELFPDGGGFGGEPPEKIEPVQDVQVPDPSSPSSQTAAKGAANSSRSASPSIHDLQEIHRKIARGDRNLTEAQQAELRAHMAKLKRIQSDRRLYFFWVCCGPGERGGCVLIADGPF